MSRYLTPSKIGFVAIILLYVEDLVPVNSSIPVLSLIVSSLLPLQSSLSSVTCDPKGGHSTTIEIFHKSLCVHASSIPGRTLWDIFLEKLWAIDSIDSLYALFFSLAGRVWSSRERRPKDSSPIVSSADARVVLSRRSPIGIFLRRTQLEFNRLQLRDAVKLWRALIIFKEPTMAMWCKRNPSVRVTSSNLNLITADLDPNTPLTKLIYQGNEISEVGKLEHSMSDIEGLLESQVDQVQSEIPCDETSSSPT